METNVKEIVIKQAIDAGILSTNENARNFQGNFEYYGREGNELNFFHPKTGGYLKISRLLLEELSKPAK